MSAETLGLILNFAGALVLAISANIQGDVTTNIVDSISGKYGTWGAEPIPEKVISELRNKKRLSKVCNWTGYLLFVGGFGLQICGVLDYFGL